MDYRSKLLKLMDAVSGELCSGGQDPEQDAELQMLEGDLLWVAERIEHYLKHHYKGGDCNSVHCIHSGSYEVE